MLFNWFRKLTGRTRPAPAETAPPKQPSSQEFAANWTKAIQAEIQKSITQQATPSFDRTPPRPVSSATTRAAEMVARNPDITPAELADALQVSKSWARTLLRRTRQTPEVPAPPPVAPTPPRKPVIAEAIPMPRRNPPPMPMPERAAAAAAPRSTPPNRRNQVLKLHAEGRDAHTIASEIGIPPGEVEFILKVQNVLSRGV